MEIHDGIEIMDLTLYVPKKKTLIATDFHMGYEESMRKKGVMIPKTQYKDVIKRLDRIFSKVKADTFVIPGDLKHEFGRILRSEWKDTLGLLDYLKERCKKVVIIKGNHDVILEPITKRKEVKLVPEYKMGDILIIHGDEEPKLDKTVKTIIMGHEHPAISISEGRRKEKFKCFMKGKYKRKNLIVMPSFNTLTTGTDVLIEPLLSPLLDRSLKQFEIFVFNDKEKDVLYFGKVKDLS